MKFLEATNINLRFFTNITPSQWASESAAKSEFSAAVGVGKLGTKSNMERLSEFDSIKRGENASGVKEYGKEFASGDVATLFIL